MSKRRYPGVYRIACQTTGDCYVGSSAYVTNRKSLHFQQLRGGAHPNQHLQRAFNKYGEEAFIFEILERPSVGQLIEREQYWIDALAPAYNIRKVAASNLGVKASEATRARQRQAWHSLSPEEQERVKQILAEGRRKKEELIANGEWQHSPEALEAIKAARAEQEITPAMLDALEQGRVKRIEEYPQPRLGMRNSEEQNRKIAQAHLGMKASEETRAKIGEASRGRKQSDAARLKKSEALKGHPVSEEMRKKIAETNRATWAKKTAEEKYLSTQKRPPVSEETRRKQSEAAKNRRNKVS